MKIAVSLICLDDLSNENIAFLSNKADKIHFDIMDGTLTPCQGLPLDTLDMLTGDLVEVHIMAKNPLPYIQHCIFKGCNTISFHIESDIDCFQAIQMIKKNNARAGLIISPQTSVEAVFPYLDCVDLVTIMTVNPGPAGQSFQKKELNKVVVLKQMRERNGFQYELEVDGSCNSQNYASIYQSGADSVVVGKSGLLNLSDNLNHAWSMMLEYMNTSGIVYIHADFVGNPLKEHVKKILVSQGYNVVDLYTDGTAEYPECARELSKLVIQSPYNMGILCCGTGLGMSMVANKIHGIRAAVVSDVYSAQMAREHNDANVLCLGSRVVTKEMSCLIVNAFLKSTFLFGKHTPRVDRFEKS